MQINSETYWNTALDIVTRSSALYSIYLLRPDLHGDDIALDETKARNLLLWAAVYGRHEYNCITIDSAFYKYITRSDGDYLTRLEYYCCNRIYNNSETSFKSIEEWHLWYYTEGVRSLKLEIFVTNREILTLSQWELSSGAAAERMTLLDLVFYQMLGDDKKYFNLQTTHGRNYFKHSQARKELKDNVPWLRVPSANATAAPIGVNLIGYVNGVLGIGEDIRAVANALQHAGIPFSICDVALSDTHATSQKSSFSSFFNTKPVFPINLFCMTAFETERLRVERGAQLFDNRYNIGLWPWELSTIPTYWGHAFAYIDEIWAISPFVADVYSKLTDKLVINMPPYVNIDAVSATTLDQFGLKSDDVVFLTMLDFNSYTARKNPYGTINAFKRAFPDQRSRERLLIKTINGHAQQAELDKLVNYIGTDPRIIVADGSLSRAETCGLIAACDCFVSLHRAEGFGRVIAEAMFLGVPVIATDWSGSTCMLDDNTGFPVKFTLKEVLRDEYIYHKGSVWAEPELEDAARMMRFVNENKAIVERKCAAAKSRIAENHGLTTVAERIAKRLTDIGRHME